MVEPTDVMEWRHRDQYAMLPARFRAASPPLAEEPAVPVPSPASSPHSPARWGVRLAITAYLCALGWGLLTHALGYNPNGHVGMYFIVWDMFCGWESFEMRRHLVAEGESGQFYDVAPPWGEFIPYGADRRHHYDVSALYSGGLAAHVLAHTSHEPINRVFLVEEAWSKKYNLPESLWKKQWDEPRQPHAYYYLRGVFEPDGGCFDRYVPWAGMLTHRSIVNNPRLREDVARGQSYVNAGSFSVGRPSPVQPVQYVVPEAQP